MGIWELLLLALSVSMDAFAVSMCKGLSVKKARLKECMTCGVWFGGFQALMPLIGFFLGSLFAGKIEKFDHWVAFGLLAIIGANMLKEVFEKECDCCDENADFSVKTMFLMAIATSIDALAVGISLAMAGNVNIYLAVVLIGVFTGTLSAIGVKIGNIFGSRYEKKAQFVGGAVLILLGVKILLEHLGVL
jgi:putative Mn2+ efflux pump MntP